ncbi:hypothetical protein [Nocardia sp. NPDC002869]|uniref:hypothetical protein n=1 Tax=Nocardia sp. NPDC002869 TaxID=3161032 RepID=UPI00398CF0C4
MSKDFGRNLMAGVVEALSRHLGKVSDTITNPWYRGKNIRPLEQGIAETVDREQLIRERFWRLSSKGNRWLWRR